MVHLEKIPEKFNNAPFSCSIVFCVVVVFDGFTRHSNLSSAIQPIINRPNFLPKETYEFTSTNTGKFVSFPIAIESLLLAISSNDQTKRFTQAELNR